MAAENRSTAVATIAPPRLPYHVGIEQRFGVDLSQWRALCESVFPNAKSTGAIVLALSYCKARKLDIFKRPVHIVPIWNPKGGENGRGGEVETVWPGISEHRTTAMRTGLYAGMEPPRMGPDVTRKFSGTVGKDNYAKKIEVELTFPQYCEITLYRMVKDQRVPFPGPRVYWLEYYSPIGKSGVPNDRWQRAPYQMIEKCAEAAALRRAFPEEIGDAWTAEEVGGAAAGSEVAPMRDVTPADEQPEPTRQQFNEANERKPTDVEHDEGYHDEVRTDDDAPVLYELFDHVGEQIGEYEPDKWVGAFDAAAPAVARKRDRAIHYQNNEDTAHTLLICGPASMRKQLVERWPSFAQEAETLAQQGDLLAGAK